MADSLFDKRYRYDYIYPRGRSGETLRAEDTTQNDRPVVIKRPAPNDAPPIRAGQEVSILNERKALKQLSGHPVLAGLLDDGQFFVGGMPHKYIVMERAEGSMIADEISELSRNGQRLPQLEILVIVDNLLDLLETAHGKGIVYNDVDAKHLFWNRDKYSLKVIDWGNAIFLDDDEVAAQGISRQSDVAQVGELIYLILTGGHRADIPRDADSDFQLDFGQDSEGVSPSLQAIISKAAHPNTKLRYNNITDLRRELSNYRIPLERERDGIVHHVIERMRRTLSKGDLLELVEILQPALLADPGFPSAGKTRQELDNRIRDLEVSAGLDAVRIYMESGNWTKSAEVLNELRDQAGPQTVGKVALLSDCCLQLMDSNIKPVPSAVLDAITLIFEGHAVHAAHTLITQEAKDGKARKLQWLLAERISSRMPDVLLLHPNLYRIGLALDNLLTKGFNVNDAMVLLKNINDALDDLSKDKTINLVELRDSYRKIVDQLTTLSKLLTPMAGQHNFSNSKLPLASLDRAIDAVMTLADNMHVIGKQAVTSPRDATAALEASRTIDPNNTLWDAILRLLDNLYELLQSYQIYVPAADGTDLKTWLDGAQKDLLPFSKRLFDEMLSGMVGGLEIAVRCWEDYSNGVVSGNQNQATNSLTDAIQAVGTVSPTLSGWLNQLRTIVDGANYIERHAISGGFGRALADGWEAFDRGRLADSEQLAQRATEISRSEAERLAAKRLFSLAGTAREWTERNGILDAARTKAVLKTIEGLYLQNERAVQNDFAAQMPGKETYLRAMQKGLVEIYTRNSAPALRIFFFESILLGALECHDGNLEDGQFWRDVAARSLGNYGARHTCTQMLDEFITRRHDLNAAQELFSKITDKATLPSLANTRRQIEENPQAKLLDAGAYSLRELEAMLHDWIDGEFRPAGLKLENAIKAIDKVESVADIGLTPYRNWLNSLQAAAAELHTLSRQMKQAIERRSDEPPEIVLKAHNRQVETTLLLLGETYTTQMHQWRDNYEQFLEIYTDANLRRSAKLERFNELFKAMFIDRHPAYPLYRHWYDITDSSAEFPAPPTDEPTPRIAESQAVDNSDYLGSRYSGDDYVQQAAPRMKFGMPSLRVIVVALTVILVVVVAYAAISGMNDNNQIVTTSPLDTPEASTTAPAQLASDETEEVAVNITTASDDTQDATARVISLITPTLVIRTVIASPTDGDTPTPDPTDTPTEEPPTDTPTATTIPTDTLTPTPTDTLTPSVTPTATLPPGGLQGWQDLLALALRLDELPWDPEAFSLNGSNWRLGIGQSTSEQQDGDIVITIAQETLDTYYGNNASTRIRSADANMSLTTYIPLLLETDDVYFGLLLQSVEDDNISVGAYIQVVNPNAVNLWIKDRDSLTFITQRSVNVINARLNLQRDPASGDVTVFFNDSQLGAAIPFVGPEAAIQPALFTKDGGVIVSVLSWRVRLR